MQAIPNSRLILNLANKFNVTCAVANQTQAQLSLHRRKLCAPAQLLVKRTKLRCECGQLAGDNLSCNLTVKPASLNTNLHGQPVVIPFCARRQTVVTMHINLDTIPL